ncbi:hypothetical protein OP853_002622 [Salmonella enterica]|nr:hypothetical protein [Salmonella enterica]
MDRRWETLPSPYLTGWLPDKKQMWSSWWDMHGTNFGIRRTSVPLQVLYWQSQ